jgi:hypothetical protein
VALTYPPSQRDHRPGRYAHRLPVLNTVGCFQRQVAQHLACNWLEFRQAGAHPSHPSTAVLQG